MKHVCSPCGKEFDTEEQYLDHECSVSGVTPRDPKNLGSDFKSVQEAALKRGEARKEKN